MRESYASVHALVFEKYRVDELYQATVVRGFQAAASAMSWIDANIVDGIVNLTGTISRGVAWIGGAIDTYFVDGAVNGVADLVLAGGRRMRRVQTGRINNYVLAVVVGVILLVIISAP
jgi:NADH-quinone oxidoreductase subunit L